MKEANCINLSFREQRARKWSRLISALLLILVSAAESPAQESINVSASQVESKTSLTITRPTSLSTVLDNLCRQTKAECLGLQQATSIVVSPQVFAGDWRKLVADLLDGTGLNYMLVTGLASPQSRLEILGKPSDPEPTANAPAGTDPARPRSLPLDRSALRADQSEERATELAVQPDTASVDEAPLPTGNANAAPEPAQGATFDRPVENAAASSNRFLPFPDSFGNPIVATDLAPQYLPFPGPDGRPIPVSNVPMPFLPFPGSDGKPIATTNQPVQYLPFPDSSGRPIPVQAATAP